MLKTFNSVDEMDVMTFHPDDREEILQRENQDLQGAPALTNQQLNSVDLCSIEVVPHLSIVLNSRDDMLRAIEEEGEACMARFADQDADGL